MEGQVQPKEQQHNLIEQPNNRDSTVVRQDANKNNQVQLQNFPQNSNSPKINTIPNKNTQISIPIPQPVLTLQAIHQINLIALLKDKGSFSQTFEATLNFAFELLEKQNYQQSAKAYEKAAEMLDIGKNILHEVDSVKRVILNANMACNYLNLRQLTKCSKSCSKAIQIIEKMLIQTASWQQALKMTLVQVILKFQHCAILSQLEEHERSLELSKSNLLEITRYLETLESYVNETLKEAYSQKKDKETVHFSRQVYKFAFRTILQLLNYIKQPHTQQNAFYYWEKNPQKNEEQLRKKFLPVQNDSCKRSILGVSKQVHWVDEFNIGSVMQMVPLKAQDLLQTYPMEEYIFKDKLYEVTIYCSMCYFTMATELRFIDSNLKAKGSGKVEEPELSISLSPTPSELANGKSSDDSQANLGKPNVKSLSQERKKGFQGNLKILNKYGYCEKSSILMQSETYHLCAIDVMSKVIKSVIPYTGHIIKSYQKHYIKQKKLQQIESIPQESFQQQQTCIQNESMAEYMHISNKKSNQRRDRSSEFNQGSAEIILPRSAFQSVDQEIKVVQSKTRIKQLTKYKERFFEAELKDDSEQRKSLERYPVVKEQSEGEGGISSKEESIQGKQYLEPMRKKKIKSGGVKIKAQEKVGSKILTKVKRKNQKTKTDRSEVQLLNSKSPVAKKKTQKH